jgi:hypothetical protein
LEEKQMSEDKQPLEQAVPVEKEMTDQNKKINFDLKSTTSKVVPLISIGISRGSLLKNTIPTIKNKNGIITNIVIQTKSTIPFKKFNFFISLKFKSSRQKYKKLLFYNNKASNFNNKDFKKFKIISYLSTPMLYSLI